MIRGGKAIIFLQIDCKILIFHTAISFFIVGEPSFSGKFLGNFQEFYWKFPFTPGVSPILAHTPYHPYTYLHTYPHPHHFPSD